jgi:hypothetical protein
MLGRFGLKPKVLLVGQKYCFEKATKSLVKTKNLQYWKDFCIRRVRLLAKRGLLYVTK